MNAPNELCTNWVVIDDADGLQTTLEDLGILLQQEYRSTPDGKIAVRFLTEHGDWPAPTLFDRIFNKSAEKLSFAKHVMPYLAPHQLLVVPDQQRPRAALSLGVSTAFYRYVEPGMTSTMTLNFENGQSPSWAPDAFDADPATLAGLIRPLSPNTDLTIYAVLVAGIQQFRMLESAGQREGEFMRDNDLVELDDEALEQVGHGVSC